MASLPPAVNSLFAERCQQFDVGIGIGCPPSNFMGAPPLLLILCQASRRGKVPERSCHLFFPFRQSSFSTISPKFFCRMNFPPGVGLVGGGGGGVGGAAVGGGGGGGFGLGCLWGGANPTPTPPHPPNFFSFLQKPHNNLFFFFFVPCILPVPPSPPGSLTSTRPTRESVLDSLVCLI